MQNLETRKEMKKFNEIDNNILKESTYFNNIWESLKILQIYANYNEISSFLHKIEDYLWNIINQTMWYLKYANIMPLCT